MFASNATSLQRTLQELHGTFDGNINSHPSSVAKIQNLNPSFPLHSLVYKTLLVRASTSFFFFFHTSSMALHLHKPPQVADFLLDLNKPPMDDGELLPNLNKPIDDEELLQYHRDLDEPVFGGGQKFISPSNCLMT
jgi:hypothetical protein